MREILFRGHRIDNYEWVEGFYACYRKRVYIVEMVNELVVTWHEVHPETVGQFTGLIDDDGMRIFEGDIVSGLFCFGMKKNALVTFEDGAFGLEWYRGGMAHFDAFTSICNVSYHVLGNIYDNPELLFKEE